ncbi:MAG TPA: hypothetical protein VFU63_05495, partial [Ktedonobacterales bacterium]|nr:hypothetical protein [Ktedonobacterales bacterium]
MTKGPLLAIPPVDLDQIPQELRETAHWLCYNRDKVPQIADASGRLASSTDPTTWRDFAQAAKCYRAATPAGTLGLGFVLARTDPWVFIDLDGCVDAATGEPNTTAKEILAHLRTYTERSPSGAGLHLLARGHVPETVSRRRGAYNGVGIEVYDCERYATVTGHHLESTPVGLLDVQDGVEWLLGKLAQEPGTGNGALHYLSLDDADDGGAPISPMDPRITDDDLLERIRRSGRGDKFRLLFDDGNYGAINPGWSASEAVQSLLCALAYWTRKDRERMDRLFRQSALYAGKWVVKWRRLGAQEIARACAQTADVYAGGIDMTGFVVVDGEDTSTPVTMAEVETGSNERNYEKSRGAWIAPEAYYGVLGQIARETEPYIEATSAPLLVNLIVASGIAMGRGPYLQVGAQRHRGVLQSVTVARTGHNKTDAYAPIMTLWSMVKSRWEQQQSSDTLDLTRRDPTRPDPVIFNGLSTGEGLLYAIRDASVNRKGEEVPGVLDKRLLVIEPEFAAVLKVMYRQDNILGV